MVLFGLEDATAVGHSEEHLVLETVRAADFPVGTAVYGVPWHVCPTVALYNDAVVVRDGRADGRWQVARAPDPHDLTETIRTRSPLPPKPGLGTVPATRWPGTRV